ncbi:unnamed protein product [Rotaria sordida]|uniref:F-box domain-containing protein n=1 Tax=Rotaria sordida TaxID=392033 RepID=A0A819RPP4_9BILA|nr:unnamed protein product [Rotaria sordida]
MSSRRLTLEDLPDEIQHMILEYLSLYDWYYSFFLLNHRYNHVIKHITPVNINTKWLNHDIDRSGILISDYWVWNDRFLYFMVPTLRTIQSNIIRWLFLAPDSVERYRKQFDKRVVQIIEKYKVQSNAPGFLERELLRIICNSITIGISCILLYLIASNKTCRTVPMLLIVNACLGELICACILLSMATFVLQNDIKQIIYEYLLCVFRDYLLSSVTIVQNYSYALQAIYRYVTVVYPTHRF